MTYLPLLTSQTMTVWSNEPVINCDPEELNDKEMISAECPCRERYQLIVKTTLTNLISNTINEDFEMFIVQKYLNQQLKWSKILNVLQYILMLSEFREN